jgi:hypothetical protein
MTARLPVCAIALLLLIPAPAAAQDGGFDPMGEEPITAEASPPAQPTPEEIEAQRLEDERAQRAARAAQLKEQLNNLYNPQPALSGSGELPSYYYIVEDEIGAPQLDYDKPIICYYREGSPIVVRVQCEANSTQCLVAEAAVFYDPTGSPSGASADEAAGEVGQSPGAVKTRLRPSLEGEPPMLRGCTGMQSAENFKFLIEQGYTLKPAILDAPYGYKRDIRGRAFQTHFDLRSRMLLGVYYTGTGLLDEFGSGLTVDTRSSYESWDGSSKKRHRFRFIEGQISLMPVEAQATLFEYESGSTGDEPAFWITTLVGEPRRYDVRLSLGGGLTLGRLDSRRYAVEGSEEVKRQTFIDLAEGRLHWELLQGTFLEDYLMLRVGGGMGTRTFQNEDAGGLYFYPEVGIRSAALIGARGLLQWQLDVRARQAWELGGASWRQVTGTTSLEWVVLAVSDQPISLFVQPELHALDMPDEDIRQLDMRVMGGLRLSLFTPPSLDPTPTPSTTAYGYGY